MALEIKQGGRKHGKAVQTILQAWLMAVDNPGKKIAVTMDKGTMALEFKLHNGLSGKEITEIEIDGEKQHGYMEKD